MVVNDVVVAAVVMFILESMAVAHLPLIARQVDVNDAIDIHFLGFHTIITDSLLTHQHWARCPSFVGFLCGCGYRITYQINLIDIFLLLLSKMLFYN